MTYGLIAVEDLKVHALARSRLAKSVSDAAWSLLLSVLGYKVAKTGSQIIRVNPWLMSQICSGCGRVVEKDLEVRMHVCPGCGLVLDRDVNAARNILQLALSSLGRSEESETWAVAPGVLSKAVAHYATESSLISHRARTSRSA